MSFSTTFKTFNKKLTEEGTAQVTLSKDSISYLDELIKKLISRFDENSTKEDQDVTDLMKLSLETYNDNKNNKEIKGAGNKSGLDINVNLVHKNMNLPEDKKKFKTEDIIICSSFVQTFINNLLKEVSNVTVNEFKKKTVTPQHVKIAIMNNSFLLKHYYSST